MERREIRAYLRQIHHHFTPDRRVLQGDRDEFPAGMIARRRGKNAEKTP